ncbi:MAG: phage holin family protein [Candidatus Nanopelagicales bacterium]|jgi:Flp pilus assembly protein TadB
MPPHAEPSLKDLVAKTAADAQRLAKAQAALFKAELSETGKNVGIGGALGVATMFIAWFAVLFLLLTIAFVLVALGLPVWAGMLIVAVLLLVGAAVTGLLAKRNIEKAKGPELAIAELEKTKAALAPPTTEGPGLPGA